jgi:hypothetical protein
MISCLRPATSLTTWYVMQCRPRDPDTSAPRLSRPATCKNLLARTIRAEDAIFSIGKQIHPDELKESRYDGVTEKSQMKTPACMRSAFAAECVPETKSPIVRARRSSLLSSPHSLRLQSFARRPAQIKPKGEKKYIYESPMVVSWLEREDQRLRRREPKPFSTRNSDVRIIFRRAQIAGKGVVHDGVNHLETDAEIESPKVCFSP